MNSLFRGGRRPSDSRNHSSQNSFKRPSFTIIVPPKAVKPPVSSPVNGTTETGPKPPRSAFLSSSPGVQPSLSLDGISHRPKREHHKPTPVHVVIQPRQSRSNVLQRQSVHKSAVAMRKATRRRRIKPTYILILSSAVFALGVGIGGYSLWASHGQPGQVAGVQDTKAQLSPFEVAPSPEEYSRHSAAPDLPRYIRIPAIKTNARANQVGFTPTTGLETPVNIFDAGWYGQSGKVGETQSMLFTVRTHGLVATGPFANLQTLKAGNFIEVEQGNGEKVFFSVVSVAPVEPGKFDMTAAAKSADAHKQGLNVIAFGPVTEGSGRYEPKLVVYAVRM